MIISLFKEIQASVMKLVLKTYSRDVESFRDEIVFHNPDKEKQGFFVYTDKILRSLIFCTKLKMVNFDGIDK